MFKPVIPALLGAAVLLLAAYVLYRNWGWWGNDQFEKYMGFAFGTLVTILVGAVSVAIGCGISDVIGEHSDRVWRENWRAKMVSLRSADGPNGRIMGGIFMLSGYIGTEQTYFYYSLNRDGSFAPHKWIPDGDTSVFEEDRKDGEVVQFETAFRHPWVEWFGMPNDRHRMDFHIPTGSIQQTFALK